LTDNGYRVNGRWAFASGCQHSDWLFGNCVVTEKGAPRAGAIAGAPETRAMMFAPAKAKIIDTWSVNGLRGTGSHDIAVENLVVPADDTFDIFLGRTSIAGPSLSEPLLYAALHIGAVAIGIADRALTEIASPYDDSPLQRCMRDIQTLTQHAAVAEAWLTTAGASLLGRASGFSA
jgi:alkylation response protein AidB-like acyl-CoA dehydrogenase